jgi:hypothetical protein
VAGLYHNMGEKINIIEQSQIGAVTPADEI